MSRFRKISLDSGENSDIRPNTAEKSPISPDSAKKPMDPDTFAKYWQDELMGNVGTWMPGQKYVQDPLAMDPTTGRNPDNDCQCDTCQIFQTPMGQATLQWARSLTKQVRDGLEMGADPEAEMNFSLMGPTARAFAGGPMDNQQYATINMTLKDAASRASVLTEPVPDWSAIRKEYELDPTITALLDWLDRRHPR